MNFSQCQWQVKELANRVDQNNGYTGPVKSHFVVVLASWAFTGEADEVIPTMKFIVAPDRATGEFIADIANNIDATNGDWQVVQTYEDRKSVV